MKKEMALISIFLPKPVSPNKLEELLGITLIKGIESTYYAEMENSLVTYTQFNVLTMINWPRSKIIKTLEELGFEKAENFDKEGEYQDYPLRIDPELSSIFSIDNNTIILKEYSLLNLLISAHVISQSVALERYEKKLAEYYEKNRYLIDSADSFSIFKRTQLARFAKQLVLIRHEMVIDLYLLDKPNILWDNEEAEILYNRLANILELKARFDIVEHKLNSIKDDIIMVMDLTNHNHSSFLEWIIIVLIFIEIIMGLVGWFKP